MSDSTIEFSYNPRTKKVDVDFIGIPKALLPKGSKYISASWDNRILSLEDAKKIVAILLEAERYDND